jgi:hypothetical protein
VAGLLAVAVFGLVLSRSYESRIRPTANTSAEVRAQLDKMAGAKILDPKAKAAVRAAFVGAYQVVMFQVAVLALASAAAGLGVSTRRRSRTPGAAT